MCCCFSARTGAIILASLGIFFGGFGLITDSIGMVDVTPKIEYMLEETKLESMKQFETAGQPEEYREELEMYWERLDYLRDLVPWIFVIQIVGALIQLVIHLCLLFGVLKHKPKFMLPWLITSMIGMVMLGLGLLVIFFVLAVASTGGILAGFIVLAVGGLVLTLNFYFWAVVRSVYLDIKEGLNGGMILPLQVEKSEKDGKKYQVY